MGAKHSLSEMTKRLALEQDRTNISEKVVAEMSTEAFEDSIETEDKKIE